jgi:hypothetical protein
MEKQMRAERDRRAAILTAEGVKQSQILTAEGDRQAAILRAEGSAQAAILNAEGEARAILQVFDAVHRGDADPKLLAYQYLQTLPRIAASPSNKVWIVPSELTGALGQLTQGFGAAMNGGSNGDGHGERPAGASPLRAEDLPPTVLPDPAAALAQARHDSEAATADAISAGTLSGAPADRNAEAGQTPYTGQNLPPRADQPPTRQPTTTRPVPGQPPATPATGQPSGATAAGPATEA